MSSPINLVSCLSGRTPTPSMSGLLRALAKGLELLPAAPALQTQNYYVLCSYSSLFSEVGSQMTGSQIRNSDGITFYRLHDTGDGGVRRDPTTLFPRIDVPRSNKTRYWTIRVRYRSNEDAFELMLLSRRSAAAAPRYGQTAGEDIEEAGGRSHHSDEESTPEEDDVETTPEEDDVETDEDDAETDESDDAETDENDDADSYPLGVWLPCKTDRSVTATLRFRKSLRAAAGLSAAELPNGRYKCEQCDRSYASQNGLSDHIRYQHVDGKIHVCTICPDKGWKTLRESNVQNRTAAWKQTLEETVPGMNWDVVDVRPAGDSRPSELRLLPALSALAPSFDLIKQMDDAGKVSGHASPGCTALVPAWFQARMSSHPFVALGSMAQAQLHSSGACDATQQMDRIMDAVYPLEQWYCQRGKHFDDESLPPDFIGFRSPTSRHPRRGQHIHL